MAVSSAHHVGVTVSDLDRAVAFYRDVLGLSVVDRFEVEGEAFATAVDVEDAAGSFAHLDAGGTRLELGEYEPVGDDREADREPPPLGRGWSSSGTPTARSSSCWRSERGRAVWTRDCANRHRFVAATARER